MDTRAREILAQLRREVWWPWDRRGGPDGGYNVRTPGPLRRGKTQDEYDAEHAEWQQRRAEYDAAPNINKNLWVGLVRELSEIMPGNPNMPTLRRLYAAGASREVIRERAELLDEMIAEMAAEA